MASGSELCDLSPLTPWASVSSWSKASSNVSIRQGYRLCGLCQTYPSDPASSLLVPEPPFPYLGNKVQDSGTHLLPHGRQEKLLALPLAACTPILLLHQGGHRDGCLPLCQPVSLRIQLVGFYHVPSGLGPRDLSRVGTSVPFPDPWGGRPATGGP